MKNRQARRYTVLSLFSGGMGLDLGLREVGAFQTVACIEKSATCCNTIRLNQKSGRLSRDMKVIEADISKLSPTMVLEELGLHAGDIDVIIGGPPCQSFSTAGRRGTVQDPRGTLLWDFLRFVEAIRPKFFLMENVRGLLSAALCHRPISNRPEKGGVPLSAEEEPGSVVRLFAKDLARFDGIGYHLDVFEVNAVNYGAPQIRERVIFIGNCYNKQIDFPAPTHGPRNGEEGQGSQISLFDPPKLIPWRTLGEALSGLQERLPVVLDFSPRKKRYLQLIPPGSNWRSLPEELQKESMGKAWSAKGGRSGWWRRLTFDLPCPTLVTMPNHASTSLCHPTETRALSLREYARIQEFPDDWEFCGTVAEQYMQVGNAVPVRLGQVAGEVLASQLSETEEGIPDSGQPLAPRVVYLQSHIRTRQWFKNGKVLVWNDGDANEDTAYGSPKTIKKVRGI